MAPLLQVIADKHAKEKTNATDIICKFFLDAVEKKQYGWCDAPHAHGVFANPMLQAVRTVHWPLRRDASTVLLAANAGNNVGLFTK